MLLPSGENLMKGPLSKKLTLQVEQPAFDVGDDLCGAYEDFSAEEEEKAPYYEAQYSIRRKALRLIIKEENLLSHPITEIIKPTNTHSHHFGNSPSSNTILDKLDTGSQQFSISFTAEGIYTVQCTGGQRSPTYYKIPQLPKKVKLSLGDCLNFGEHTYCMSFISNKEEYIPIPQDRSTVIIPRGVAVTPLSDSPEIRIKEVLKHGLDEEDGEVFNPRKAQKTQFLLGRDVVCDLFIDDMNVSMNQCIIGFHERVGWYVAEPEVEPSRNGSYLAINTYQNLLNSASSEFEIFDTMIFRFVNYNIEVGILEYNMKYIILLG